MSDDYWRDKYNREVLGLNNEGDPIGGDPPRGLNHLCEHLREELGRAYRALHGYHNACQRSEMPNAAMQGYHALTVAAARRFIEEGALDGTDYFIGKSIDVLRKYQT